MTAVVEKYPAAILASISLCACEDYHVVSLLSRASDRTEDKVEVRAASIRFRGAALWDEGGGTRRKSAHTRESGGITVSALYQSHDIASKTSAKDAVADQKSALCACSSERHDPVHSRSSGIS